MIKNGIEGQVASLNVNGDLVTDIANEKCVDIPGRDAVKVKVGAHETVGIHLPDHGEPPGTLIAVEGESGNIEIGITGVSVSEMLGITIGEKVQITW